MLKSSIGEDQQQECIAPCRPCRIRKFDNLNVECNLLEFEESHVTSTSLVTIREHQLRGRLCAANASENAVRVITSTGFTEIRREMTPVKLVRYIHTPRTLMPSRKSIRTSTYLIFRLITDLEACAASDGGKQTLAHAVSISSGGPPILLVAEEETFSFPRQ
jgi:hypothetical protein